MLCLSIDRPRALSQPFSASLIDAPFLSLGKLLDGELIDLDKLETHGVLPVLAATHSSTTLTAVSWFTNPLAVANR